MPDKQKSAQKSRVHKESKKSARGAKKTRLTEVQKINLVSGGFGHRRLRKGETPADRARRDKL